MQDVRCWERNPIRRAVAVGSGRVAGRTAPGGTIHTRHHKGAPLEACKAMALVTVTALKWIINAFSPKMFKNTFRYSDFPSKHFHRIDEGHDWSSNFTRNKLTCPEKKNPVPLIPSQMPQTTGMDVVDPHLYRNGDSSWLKRFLWDLRVLSFWRNCVYL